MKLPKHGAMEKWCVEHEITNYNKIDGIVIVVKAAKWQSPDALPLRQDILLNLKTGYWYTTGGKK